MLKFLPDQYINEVNTADCITVFPGLSDACYNVLWFPYGTSKLAKGTAAADTSVRNVQQTQRAVMKLWDGAHTVTKYAECEPIPKHVPVAGSRCWRLGHHVCNGPSRIVDMALHQWEALVKRQFPPGPSRSLLRTSRILVYFYATSGVAPDDAPVTVDVGPPVEATPPAICLASSIVHTSRPWSAGFQIVYSDDNIADPALHEIVFFFFNEDARA